MGQLFYLPKSTLSITDNAAHTVDLYLPSLPNTPRPVSEMDVGLLIKPTLVTGTDVTTNLTVTATPIVTPEGVTAVVAANYTATTLASAITWVNNSSYLYDCRFLADGLPFFGVRVSITYTAGSVGVKEISAAVRLITE